MKNALQLSKKERNRAVLVMMVGSFIAIINQTLLATALPEIMVSFHLTLHSAQWITTIFMLVNGIMIPISAYLTTRYTTKGLYFTAITLFMIGSLFCIMTPFFSVLLLGRVIQAIGAGILIPLIQVVLLVAFPIEERGKAMGAFGLVTGFSPAIGPTLSGWILSHFRWPAIFILVLIAMIINLGFSLFTLKNMSETHEMHLDLISVFLSTLAFGGFLYGFSRTSYAGFSDVTLWFVLVISTLALGAYIVRQRQLEEPMLNFDVLKERTFLQSCLIIMIMFVIFNASMTLLPFFIQKVSGMTAFQSGLLLLPGGLMMGILAPVTGNLFEKVGGRSFALIGMALIAFSALVLSFFDARTNGWLISLVFMLLMAGNAFILTPLTTEGMNALPNKLIPHGSAMNSTMRQLFAAIGTAI